MLFQFQGKPQRLARLFKLFNGMALRLRRHRSKYAWTVMLAGLVYAAICATALPQVESDATGIFWFFLGAGALFLSWAWMFSAVLQRYPSNRKGTSSRVLSSIGLLIVAGIGVLATNEDGLAWLGEAVAATPRTQVLGAWGLASLGVFLLSRWIVWLRLRDEMLQDHELDFLQRLMLPLLRDLPPDAACSFSCNPFTPMWSEKFSTENKGMRRLDISDDVLLDFKAKLGEDTTLALQTFCRRVDKYKSTSKKTKFKGTKHRVATVCRLQNPALASLGKGETQQLNQVCAGLKGKRRNYEMAVRQDLRAGKITVVGKARFDKPGELGSENLPDVEAVLNTVRALSAFTARLGPAQKPA